MKLVNDQVAELFWCSWSSFPREVSQRRGVVTRPKGLRFDPGISVCLTDLSSAIVLPLIQRIRSDFAMTDWYHVEMLVRDEREYVSGL